MNEPRLRPLTTDDAPEAFALIGAAFDAAQRAAGEEPEQLPESRRADLRTRLAHFPVTDPDGCWAAEGEEGLLGIGVAIRRASLWGLALLFVHPDHQSSGLGRRLIERTRATAEGASVELIMASEDPRAIRRYASLGLALHPGFAAKGVVPRAALPAGLPVREGSAADLDLVEAVDRDLRGGPTRTEDIRFLLEHTAATLHVLDRGARRGFVVEGGRGMVCLGATDEASATDLLWAGLAQCGDDEVWLHGLTATQGWTVDVALAARLAIRPAGPMFVRGWPALPRPYLPSGVYF